MIFLYLITQFISLSDVIQIFGIFASLITGTVAIFISLKTLSQSSESIQLSAKSIEDSTRPFISVYIDTITICEQKSYFVLKNFGASPATIIRFDYSSALKNTKQANPMFQNQFDYIRELTLAPGQNKLLEYDFTRLNGDTVTFKIGYITTSKLYYEETITLNVKHYIHIPIGRPSSSKPDWNERLAHSAREIIERIM